MRKLCLSTKFPHQEIRWNYGILCSAIICVNSWLEKKKRQRNWKWLASLREIKSLLSLFFGRLICNLVSLLLIFLTANKSLEGFGGVEVLSVFLNNCEASKRNEFFVLHGVSPIIALSKQYLFYTLSHFPVEPKFSKTRSCFFPTFDDILFFGWKKRKNENGWERMDFNVLTYTHEKCNIPFFPKIFLMRLRI